MTKLNLLVIAVLALGVTFVICYGAIRTAERIAAGRMSPALVETFEQ